MSYLKREPTPLNTSPTNTPRPETTDDYVSLSNDWDLDAAFFNSSQPYLSLHVELASFSQTEAQTANDSATNNEWEVIHTNECPQKLPPTPTHAKPAPANSSLNIMNLDQHGTSLIALWSSKAADKAISVFQKAADKTLNTLLGGLSRSGSFSSVKSTSFNAEINNPQQQNENKYKNGKQPLGDQEFRNFLDSDGRIVQPQELRQRIFEGGCEPSKRKELWPILLGVYPHAMMTREQRAHFLAEKSAEYVHLKRTLWHKQDHMTSASHRVKNENAENMPKKYTKKKFYAISSII